MKPTQEKTMEWETKVWAWITKEMPHKHSDRFAPLFKIIHEIYEKAYQDASKRFRIRESELLKIEQDSFRRKVEEIEELLDCPYTIDKVSVPKVGIEKAPPYQVVGTLSVSLTRLQKVKELIKSLKGNEPN